MPSRHPKPGEAVASKRFLPTWEFEPREEKRKPKEGDAKPAKSRRRLSAEADAGLEDAVDEFLSRVRAAGSPEPDRETILSRCRHILRFVDDDHQRIVLVASPVPPYFGATTAAGRGVEPVPESVNQA